MRVDGKGKRAIYKFVIERMGIILAATLFGQLANYTSTLSIFRSCKHILRPCLVPQKFYKIFQIPRHIESLDV